MITKPFGPSVCQVLRMGLLNRADKIKIAIEVLKVISQLHDNNFLLNTVSLENVHFSQEIDEAKEQKNRIIITNFDQASKLESEMSTYK